MHDTAWMLAVAAGFAGAAQFRLRAALRRFASSRAPTYAERYRAGARALLPVMLAVVPVFLLCIHFHARATAGGASARALLALAAALALLLAGAWVPFLQYRRVAGGVALPPRAVAALLARSVVFQLLVQGTAVGVPLAAVLLAARVAPGAPAGARVAVAILAGLAGLTLTFVVFPLLVRALHRGRRLDDPALREGLARLSAASGMEIAEIYRVESPTREANAMVSGLLPRARFIFLTDALLAGAAPDEIVAVVAHELAHIRHRHLARNLLWAGGAALTAAAGMFALSRAVGPSTAGRGPLPVVGAAMGLWVVGALLFRLPASRTYEHQADRTAAEWVGRETYARALTRLYALNLAGDEHTPAEHALSTHPSLRRRLEHLRAA